MVKNIVVGEIYYCMKNYWDERCGSQYFPITVISEGDRVWNCDGCTINKRSKMMTDGWKDRYKVFTGDEVAKAQWIGNWKHMIGQQVDRYCDYDKLWLIADILDMDAPLVDPVLDDRRG